MTTIEIPNNDSMMMKTAPLSNPSQHLRKPSYHYQTTKTTKDSISSKVSSSIESQHPEIFNLPAEHEKIRHTQSQSSNMFHQSASSQFNDSMNEGLSSTTFSQSNHTTSSELNQNRSTQQHQGKVSTTLGKGFPVNNVHQQSYNHHSLAGKDCRTAGATKLSPSSVKGTTKDHPIIEARRPAQIPCHDSFQTFHHPSPAIPALLLKKPPGLGPENNPPPPPLYYFVPNEEVKPVHHHHHHHPPPPVQQNFLFPTAFDLPKAAPDFPATNMMPLPYYAFPYVDYRSLSSDSYPKDGNHPAPPPYPIYAIPPTGVVAHSNEPPPSVPMAILSPPAATVLCAPAPPEAPQFGPGPPIITGERLKGPRGCNLFVFHLPNEITNWDLYLLFRRYGTILSVHIMVNKATGLSKGYGFVSFAFPEDSKSAMEGMDGFRLGKKRLKVQLKRLQDDTSDDFMWEDGDMDQSTSEFTSAQTSASTTTQPSPNKGHNAETKQSVHTTTAVPTQGKLQEATKRLNEMNLMGTGSAKYHQYKIKPRDPATKEPKV